MEENETNSPLTEAPVENIAEASVPTVKKKKTRK